LEWNLGYEFSSLKNRTITEIADVMRLYENEQENPELKHLLERIKFAKSQFNELSEATKLSIVQFNQKIMNKSSKQKSFQKNQIMKQNYNMFRNRKKAKESIKRRKIS
jgi:uncharacterized protein YfbU (UPF0304 family)